MWRLGLFFGMLICLVQFIRTKLNIIGFCASSLWFYTLLSSLISIEFPRVFHGIYNTAFMATAGQSFAESILIPLTILSVPREWDKKFFHFFSAIVLIEIALIWLKIKGLMVAPSFDTALIALFIPFAPIWLVVLSVVTILSHHGSTAMMILGVQGLVYLQSKNKLKLGLLCLVPTLLLVAWFHSNGPMLDGGERWDTWKSFIIHWWDGTKIIQNEAGRSLELLSFGGDWISRFIGVGSGSFVWVSLITEPKKMFLQAHSELVQISIELGLFGLSLFILTILDAIKNTLNRPKILAAVLGCVACSLTYHPLRWFQTSILVGFIFKQALMRGDYNEHARS